MNQKNVRRVAIGMAAALVIGIGGWGTAELIKKENIFNARSVSEKDPFDVQNTTFHEGTNIVFGYLMDNIGIQHVTINSTAKGATFLNNVTVTQTATLALLSGVRKVTITNVTGVLAGDRVLLTPVSSTPAGYALADVVATANGTLEVSFTAPALAINQSFSIPCKLTIFR